MDWAISASWVDEAPQGLLEHASAIFFSNSVPVTRVLRGERERERDTQCAMSVVFVLCRSCAHGLLAHLTDLVHGCSSGLLTLASQRSTALYSEERDYLFFLSFFREYWTVRQDYAVGGKFSVRLAPNFGGLSAELVCVLALVFWPNLGAS